MKAARKTAAEKAAAEKAAADRFAEMLGALTDVIAGAVAFGQMQAAGLILALAERRAIEPARVFQFYTLLADAVETAPGATATSKISARMLREVEAMARNLSTQPPGAGRA